MFVQTSFTSQTDKSSFGDLIFYIGLVEPDDLNCAGRITNNSVSNCQLLCKKTLGRDFENFTLNIYFLSRFNLGNRHSFSIVLITNREVPEQVFDGFNS